MLYGYVVLDSERTIHSVNRSVEGAAMFAFSWGEPQLPTGEPFSAEALDAILRTQPSVRVAYPNDTYLDIECHGLNI